MKTISITLLLAAASLAASEKAKEEEPSPEFRVVGEVPEGWEVVELTEAPAIEKIVTLKNGDEKRLFLKPFVLKPQHDDQPKFSVSNPGKVKAGSDLKELLEDQNSNISHTSEEMSAVLARLKQLLLSLPDPTESK
ncbi:hypothetical protein AAFN60_07310 [Roseibacillus persicicus]|uniref:hypothetical protein n=1 Tax=Roseibacillus persicicus TaxID=454148 RepID=UPI00167A3665|nr:hypothetical protein [Roseibacillus persicicus]